MNLQTDLQNQFRGQQQKYVYYLIALAVAAIGFSVVKTFDESLRLSQAPLAIAVLCWASSIFFGLKFIKYAVAGLYNNAMYLDILAGRHEEVGNHPEMIKAAAEGAWSGMQKNSRRAALFLTVQEILFYVGIVSFLVWHVYEMYLRSCS